MIEKEKVARPEGLEPPTLCLEGRRSIQLSYGRGALLILHRLTGGPHRFSRLLRYSGQTGACFGPTRIALISGDEPLRPNVAASARLLRRSARPQFNVKAYSRSSAVLTNTYCCPSSVQVSAASPGTARRMVPITRHRKFGRYESRTRRM